MPLIEKIGEMQKQGLDEEAISRRLQDEGISPKEIYDAIDQAKVKSAVSDDVSGMEPSLMKSPAEGEYSLMPEEGKIEQAYPQESEAFQEPPEQFQQYQPRQYSPMIQEIPAEMPQYQYEPRAQQPIDTELIAEIIGQIADEKTEKLQKQIFETSKFKNEIQGRIEFIEERLKRIEMIIDRLQLSILKEIGSYGLGISDLKQEMQATQESFSKILNPLSENIRELRKITGRKSETKEKKKGKNNPQII